MEDETGIEIDTDQWAMVLQEHLVQAVLKITQLEAFARTKQQRVYELEQEVARYTYESTVQPPEENHEPPFN